MNLHKFLILIICVLTLTSCFKEEDEVKIYADVSGVVNDGVNPVPGAEIHIKSHFKPGGFVEGTSYGEGIPLQINVIETGAYKISLLRLGYDSPFAEVLDDTLTMGQHIIVIPDSLLSNGVYLYELVTPNGQTYKENFLINRTDSTLAATVPVTVTNSLGEFEINAEYLAIGEKFARRQGGGFSISDSLQIIVVLNDSIAAREYLQVGEEGNFVEVNLQ